MFEIKIFQGEFSLNVLKRQRIKRESSFWKKYCLGSLGVSFSLRIGLLVDSGE